MDKHAPLGCLPLKSRIKNTVLETFRKGVALAGTIGTLVLAGYGHFADGKILAAFGNPILSCKHSSESPFQLS